MSVAGEGINCKEAEGKEALIQIKRTPFLASFCHQPDEIEDCMVCVLLHMLKAVNSVIMVRKTKLGA